MALLSEDDRKYLLNEFNTKLNKEVKLLYFSQEIECTYCRETREILNELSSLSDKINVDEYNFVNDKDVVEKYKIDKIPAIAVVGEKDYGIRYFGIPAGYEFSSLVEDIIDVSRGTTDLSDDTKKALQKIDKPIHIQVFVTPTCPYCPTAVRTAHKLAMESEHIRGDMIESTEFPQLANKYGVYAVPKIVINENISFEGALLEKNFLDYVLSALKE